MSDDSLFVRALDEVDRAKSKTRQIDEEITKALITEAESYLIKITGSDLLLMDHTEIHDSKWKREEIVVQITQDSLEFRVIFVENYCNDLRDSLIQLVDRYPHLGAKWAINQRLRTSLKVKHRYKGRFGRIKTKWRQFDNLKELGEILSKD